MSDPRSCEHCGSIHCVAVCWRIKAIDYYEDGLSIKRIEYHPSQPVVSASQIIPQFLPPIEGAGLIRRSGAMSDRYTLQSDVTVIDARGTARVIRAGSAVTFETGRIEILPLHVGPANMVVACGGREVTNGTTIIRVEDDHADRG